MKLAGAARGNAPQSHDPLELDAAASACGRTVEELLAIATDFGADPIWTAELLVEQQAAMRRLAEGARPGAMPRSRRPLSDPERVLVDAQLAVERAGSIAVGTAADNMLPKHLRGGAHGRPSHTSYRSMVTRRVGDMPHPPLWFYRIGAVPQQVWAWLEAGKTSENPVERAVTGALRAERNKTSRRKVFAIAALAHLLWFDARKTMQPGYSAVVEGAPRGALAKRCAHYHCGEPLHPDTVSRNLVRLGKVLGGRGHSGNTGGLLEWEQVPPSEAVRHRLHKSTHYLSDGSVRIQATNIYRWRDAEWVAAAKCDPASFENRANPAKPIEKAKTPISIDSLSRRVDLNAGYLAELKDQGIASLEDSVMAVSSTSPALTEPAPPPTDRIRPPAAASVSTVRSRGDPTGPVREPDNAATGFGSKEVDS